MRDQGEIWDETKTIRPNILLTPTAAKILQDRATSLGISRSELVERLLRSLDNALDTNSSIDSSV